MGVKKLIESNADERGNNMATDKVPWLGQGAFNGAVNKHCGSPERPYDQEVVCSIKNIIIDVCHFVLRGTHMAQKVLL